jgi:hypothetical protein
MAHAKGAYLGSVRSVADVRLRCVVDPGDDGCWHLRTAHGRAQPRDRVHRLCLYGHGPMSATKAVWQLDRGRVMPQGRRAVRMCASYDCGNPAHIKALTHAEAQRRIVGAGGDLSPSRRLQLRVLQSQRRRLTAEQLHEIRNSSATAVALARSFGCSPTTVTAVRRGLTYRDGPTP